MAMRGVAAIDSIHNLRPNPDGAIQTLTVSDSVKQISFSGAQGSIDAKTTHVVLSVDSESVSATYDGTDPEAAVGHFWAQSTNMALHIETARALKLIRATGSDARVTVSEFVIGPTKG